MSDSKLKYLALIEILKNNSSNNKPLTTSEICEMLSQKNIVKNKRNLPRDIGNLSSLGYSIKKTKKGHENAFYLETNNLDESELRIVLDALQAATFITKEKTETIKEKILTMSPDMEYLRYELENSIYFNSNKSDDDLAASNISVIAKAIREKRKLSFLCFDLDENYDKIYHKNGELRTEEPVALVYNDDKYYLLTYNRDSNKDGRFIHYRVDRMDSVSEISEDISQEAFLSRSEVFSSLQNVISMFSGEYKNVVLETSNARLLKYFFEKFGTKNTKIIKLYENKYIASINAHISPTFFGWLFQFAGEMTIISPEETKMQYIRMVSDILDKSNIKL